MRFFAFIVAVMVATPAVAESNREKHQRIYNDAKVLCSLEDPEEAIAIIKKKGYTNEDRYIFANLCLMYLDGRIDEINRRLKEIEQN